ncbi:MAG TPA: SNF2 helicase-associated domain-containing protein, partial [Candidatus Dormibacteraeota bacterium]|nr:SNF2 helicase-associated domain-containing protein [Candidatus Dormibacteraeota bacterium]
MSLVSLAPVLTPHGRLIVERHADAPALDAELAQRMEGAFTHGSGHGVLALGADEIGVALPPAFSFWREFAALYVTGVCTGPAEPHLAHPPAPPKSELDQFVLAAPSMTGAEYLSAGVLSDLWQELDRAFWAELTEAKCSIEEFLKRRNPAWNLVGRVHFNLAENRKDEAAPFAFLATYTTRLSAHAKAQHVPLDQALREYAGAENRDRLLSLLLPVQRAAESCSWLRAMVDTGDIFHPLRWVPAQAMQLLRDVEKLESAGVVVRMPATWRANRPPRAQVAATVGGRPPSGLGQAALLDFHLDVVLDGERLSKAEVQELLRTSDGLALVRGRWVEVDSERLRETLEHFGEIERTAAEQGISFREAMRMLAGTDVAADGNSAASVAEWGKVAAGPWLAEILKGLRTQEGLARVDPGPALKGTLRPYQRVGVRWLYLLAQLGLGACLADDMGLGKTIQVLALLLVICRQSSGARAPSLLVAPASLLANWASELER